MNLVDWIVVVNIAGCWAMMVTLVAKRSKR